MNNLRKIVALIMCLCMMLGMTAVAEENAAAELTAETVVATLNGEQVLWSEVEANYTLLINDYGSYYDMADPENEALFRAVAMENVIAEKLLLQKAVEMGVRELSAEEVAEAETAAKTDWAAAIDSYLAYYYPDLTAESPAEEIEKAEAEADGYFRQNGYDPDVMVEDYKKYIVLDKVQQSMIQDVAVTDADVEALYQQLVAADKELYEDDVYAYVSYNSQVDMMDMYAAMYGMPNDMDYAWYKPEGFRAVRHILLPVDEELMNTYTDLQARFEEQLAAEGEEADAADPATTEAPVTEEQVSEAKAAIFASVADKIEEINQKVADGVDFDELITAYGVNADGTPSDPGMVSNPYYEVCAASDSVYVAEFVDAAMSIEEVGGVSAPYLSSFGIHIVKYVADIPGGPVEMTDAQRAAKQAQLLAEKQNEVYAAALDQWLTESAIEYTGVIAPYEELEAAEAQ